MKKTNLFIIFLIILSFIVGIYFYPQMPEQLASHWDSQGQVNGYMGKFLGLFLFPFILVGIFLIFLIIPYIDPLKKNIEKFRRYYDWFVLIISLFLFYIYLLTIAWNLGYRYNMNLAIIPAIGFLFIFMGLMLEKVKRNWFIGIRTPWTLSSDIVWEKTHKLGSRLFKISGIIMILGVFFQAYLMWFILVPVIGTVIWLFVYSYLEYKKLKK